jgi:hypothetical protein
LTVAVACSQTKGPRTFDLDLPGSWREANALIVVFHDLEVPENRPVVFRLFAPGKGDETSIGSLPVVATSPEARGMKRIERAEVNVTTAFRRWAETSKPGRRVSIRVEPFAGLREAKDYAWKVREVKVELR